MWIFSQNKKMAINSKNIKSFSLEQSKGNHISQVGSNYKLHPLNTYLIKADSDIIAIYKDKYKATEAYEDLMSHVANGNLYKNCYCLKEEE